MIDRGRTCALSCLPTIIQRATSTLRDLLNKSMHAMVHWHLDSYRFITFGNCQNDEAHKYHQPSGRNRLTFHRHVAGFGLRNSILVNLYDDDGDSAVLSVCVCSYAFWPERYLASHGLSRSYSGVHSRLSQALCLMVEPPVRRVLLHNSKQIIAIGAIELCYHWIISTKRMKI